MLMSMTNASCFTTVNTVTTPVFDALAIGSGLVAAV